ncbi:MAG TPA: fumarylacetoacetate hydrolase family protein [Steroidobacteraceae bacterium]|nr:fumarylacetoacetate hydrolase family protein [Steroidobacteraceae bacterium]
MKLASVRNGLPDGGLVVVSRDLSMTVPAADIAPNLQAAIDRWDEVSPALYALYDRLNAGRAEGATVFHPDAMAAPLPRAWQWLDGSAFPSHGKLMQKAFNLPPIVTDLPLMYQGMSHQFLGPTQDVPFVTEQDDIDFEGEFGVITDAVSMGTTAARALGRVRLAVQINDWSLRAIAPIEMKTGFGWIQAKPACSVAPVAISLDELGPAWAGGRILATLDVQRGGALFGAVPSTEMAFGFHDLIAHAARTRSLCAGTIIGSGTLSTASFRDTGSCCIAERRAIEMIDFGAPRTGFLSFGERVRMEARIAGRAHPLFGAIEQTVIEQTVVGGVGT